MGRESIRVLIETMRDMQGRLQDGLATQGIFLTTGLIIANGTALLTSFSAVAEGHICEPAAFAVVPWCFTIGLVLAFAGSVYSHDAGGKIMIATSRLISTMTRKLDTDEDVDADIQSQLDRLAELQLGRRYFLLLKGLSAAALVAGIVLALTYPPVIGAICRR